MPDKPKHIFYLGKGGVGKSTCSALKAIKVSENLKIRYGENKILQKKSLGHYTIEEILKRKDKYGFEIPTEQWMKAEKWKKLKTDNLSFLKQNYPDIFKKNSSVPSDGDHVWKIIQLGTWINLNWN